MKFMKKFAAFILIFVIVLSLCACKSHQIEVNIEQDSPVYVSGEDDQNFIRDTASFTQGDGGYYFLDNSILSFYDPVENEAYPVCDRANCLHNNSDCPAYLSMLTFYPGMSLFYYNANIYLLGHEENNGVQSVYLYQISPKTLKRQKAAYLYDNAGSIGVNFFIHRGYVYFIYNGGEIEQTTATLYRTQLGDVSSDAPESVYTYSGIGANLISLSAHGNYIYFKTASYADSAGNGYATALHYINIHDFNDTGEIVKNGYSYFAGDDSVYYFKNENSVYRYDMKSGKDFLFCTLNGPCYISGDSNYIYFDNMQANIVGNEDKSRRQIYVYDKSGSLATQFAPRGADDDCYFGGGDVLLFQSVTIGEQTESSLNDYYILNKSQISEENKTFKDINALK